MAINPNELDWEQNDNKQVAEQIYDGGIVYLKLD